MGTRLGELVNRFGGQLEGDADIEVAAIAPLDRAGASDIAANIAATSRAGQVGQQTDRLHRRR